MTQRTTVPIAADVERWRDDPVAFAHEHFPIAATGQNIVLLPHQQAILRALFTPPYPSEAVYSTVKKSGKTALGALIGLIVGVCYATEGSEIICAANDEEQAQSRVFADIKYAVEHDALLRKSADIQARQITLANGVVIRAISSDYGSASGSRHALAIFDELWAYVSERSQRLYDELTAIPTLPFSMRLVVSSAGFEGESKTLKVLYDRAMKGERVVADLPVFRNRQLFAYWDEGAEARRMPWQQGERGEDYYAAQAEELRPGQFLRLHENRWTAGLEAFVTAEQWDACVVRDLTPMLVGDPTVRGNLFVGVDVGTKHDSSAVVVVERTASRVRLVTHRVWVPTPSETIEIESTVEAYLRELLTSWRVRRVRADPYQFAQALQRLQRAGFSQVEEYPQTSPNLTAMGNSLTEVLKGRNLELYPDDEMRRSALQAVAIESGRGWRIAKEKSRHRIDVIVALAMAVHAALAEVPNAVASATLEPDEYYTVTPLMTREGMTREATTPLGRSLRRDRT